MDRNSLVGLVALVLLAAMVGGLVYCGKVDPSAFLMVVSAIVGGVTQRYFPTRQNGGGTVPPPVGPVVGIVLAALAFHAM
jgi:hypothetical protein